MWQKIAAEYNYSYIYNVAKLIGKAFFRFYIYIDWQKDVENRLKFKHTIIDNYRCK